MNDLKEEAIKFIEKSRDLISWNLSSSVEDPENYGMDRTFGISRIRSNLIEKSNHDVAIEELSKFLETEDVIDYIDSIAVRALDNKGNVTEAFKRLYELWSAYENYAVLDDSDFSKRQYEACLKSINQVGRRFITLHTNENWEERVHEWLWDNNQEALEPQEGDICYPNEEDVVEALRALGLIDESEVEEGSGYSAREIEISKLNEELAGVLKKLLSYVNEILQLHIDQLIKYKSARKFSDLYEYIFKSIVDKTTDIRIIIIKLTDASKNWYKDINNFDKIYQHIILEKLTVFSNFIGNLKEISIKLKALGIE